MFSSCRDLRREGSRDLKPDFLRVVGDDGVDVVDCVTAPGMSDGFRDVAGEGVDEASGLGAIMVCVDTVVKHARMMILSSSCFLFQCIFVSSDVVPYVRRPSLPYFRFKPSFCRSEANPGLRFAG